jgi:hypothetical protein
MYPHDAMYANRTTPQEDIADLKRMIRRVEAVVDRPIQPSSPGRATTARDLLPVLRRALRQAEAMGQSSLRLPPAGARVLSPAGFITAG